MDLPSPPPDAKVLLVRLSALGDLVFALPALQALRHQLPQAHLTWLAEDRCAALPQSHPGVDRTLVFPRARWKARRGLGKLGGLGAMADHLLGVRDHGRFDLVLDLQGNLKSAMHLLFVRAEVTLGFEREGTREGAHRFVSHRVPAPGRVHRSEHDLALVRALGYRGAAPPPTTWPLDRQAVKDADLRLGHFLSAPPLAVEGGPLVLLHTETTRYGQDKAWPEARWIELARQLADARGARVLLLWDEASRGRVLARVEASEGACGLAPPTPDLQRLMALTDRAALLVGTDSGPLHLAAYRGTPVVALFGPTDPVRYAPLGAAARVVYALAEGEEPPPRDRGGPSPLMERITVEDVAAACLEQLGG